MSQTQVKKHIHKIKLHKYKSGNMTYFCVDDCNYKVTPALALGKIVLCWRCGEKFKMNEYSLRLVKPHCENCHKSKHLSNEAAKVMNSDINGTRIDWDEKSEEVKESIRNGSWDTNISLTDRLKQATKQENEEEEEL